MSPEERHDELKAMFKEEVGEIYRELLHDPEEPWYLAHHPKKWMIYDILRAEYGRAAAEKLVPYDPGG